MSELVFIFVHAADILSKINKHFNKQRCKGVKALRGLILSGGMASNALKLASTSSLREIRLHLCQKSAASAGVRDFISKHYVELKKANPKFPILIRECSGITPRVWARYTYGQEQSVDLTNKSAADVLKTLTSLSKN